MAVRIKFDNTHVPLQPTFVLANRNGNKLGCIPATGINFGDHLDSASELQFSVPREENGVVCNLWDDIIDFKLVWCPEWDTWFEIKVDVSEGEYITKNITATSLGEAELSQINLYEVEINTENDIAREDYVVTVLYQPDKPEGSLLHRITEKAPHYRIGHVDASIADIQRTFSFDGTSILDALYEISEEIDCLFIIDSGSNADGSIARTINAYDLESICNQCGYRGVYHGSCPECGSTDVSFGYGNDTTIFVTSENLTDEISYSSNTDSVKNCFRLVGGDDLMTATIINCNPNGSGYLWYFSDEVKQDMSDALRKKLEDYDAEYAYYFNEKPFTIPSGLLSKYNALINKYKQYQSSMQTVSNPISGYSRLMNLYYDTIDFEMLLKNTLMPSVEISETTAEIEAAKLTRYTLSPTAVTNLASCSTATASSSILAIAKQVVRSSYQVKVENGYLDGTTWTGNFVVTNYSDESDTARSEMVEIEIIEDQKRYLSQRIDKVLADAENDIVDIAELFKLSLVAFEAELKKYCLASLNSMRDICQTCLDILIEQGIADKKTWANTTPNLYNELYVPYYNKLNVLIYEVKLREQEIAIVTGQYDANGGLLDDGIQSVIEHINSGVQSYLNLETFLGEELTSEMAAYRREDTYQNDNFISDGLNNQEVFAKALEFIALAKAEIYKSATLQHTISSTLKNLLVMKEFEPITESFEVGNWLSISVADKINRLRLISYEIDFDNLDSLNVEFSDVVETIYGKNDVQSILKSASSISSSFASLKRQAIRGDQSHDQLVSFVSDGLSLADMRIISNSDNQNITMDHHGLLCRRQDPISGLYETRQLKIINKGLYLTSDGWETSRAGIGVFRFYDPLEGKEKEDYGVVANTLIGHLILSETVGVYNKENTIRLDKNGFTLISTNDGENNTVFRIQKKTVKEGEEVLEDVIYFDDQGNANFNGIISATAIVSDRTVAELLAELNYMITDVEVQYAQNQSDTVAPTSGWSTTPPVWQKGYFIWQRMAMTSDSGTEYTTPACVSGRDGESVTVERVEYAEGTSGSTPPGSGWQRTIPAITHGRWLWCRITFSDNTQVLTSTYSGTDGQDGAKGDNGDDAYIHIAWANSADGTQDFSTTVSAGKRYLGVYGDHTATASLVPSDYAWSLIKGADGVDGSNGLNQATIYLFARNATAPTKPSITTTYTFSTGALSTMPTGWSRAIPNGTTPCWVTSVSVVSSDATISIASEDWSNVSKLVEDGEDGTSVTVSSVAYASGNSGTVPPDTGWQSNIPSVDQGHWLWCKTTYSNNTTALICSYMGTDGVLMDGYEVATIAEIRAALEVEV